MPKHIAGLVLAVALVGVPERALADPVVITDGGWYNVFFPDGGGIILVSDQFSVRISTNSAEPRCAPGVCRPGFMPGQVVSFSASTATNGFESSGIGTGTVNGVLHVYPDSPISYQGTVLQFDAAPITIPAVAPFRTVYLTAPFVMNGTLDMAANGQPLFSSAVTGTGQVSIDIHNAGTSIDAFPQEFIFGPVTPATTPEPASLALFGIGVLGLFIAGVGRTAKPSKPRLCNFQQTA